LGGNTNTNSTNAISTLFSYGDYYAALLQYSSSPQDLVLITWQKICILLHIDIYILSQDLLLWEDLLLPQLLVLHGSRLILPLTINNRLNNDMLSTSSITVKEIEE